MYCWICNDILFNQYYLLPVDDNIPRETYHVIKKIECFTFLYNKQIQSIAKIRSP